jgi:hypothetical protein
MSTDRNTGAAKGQAINLAAADARKHDKESDPKYIYQRYIYWSALCEAIQGSDLDMIQEVIDSKNFDEAIKLLKESLK